MILAAGIGSRYGGLKQVDGMGPNGQAIIDYSVFDAIRAGFGKVVFVIRKEIEKDFREKVGKKIEKNIDTVYAFQELDTALDWMAIKPNRAKPWGTGHAMLAGKDALTEPFAVINADDFYGKAAFETIAGFLKNDCTDALYGMVGYAIQNTLSANGSVSRGVCSVNSNAMLTTVTERTKIQRQGTGIFYTNEHGKNRRILKGTPVSMNFWGFHPGILSVTEKMFRDFVQSNMDAPRAEFFIPLIVNALIQEQKIDLKVLESDSKWFGVTYPQDKPSVQKAIHELTASGVYPELLWA